MSILKTLGIGLESLPISRLVLVLVLSEMKNQDTSWYWSQKRLDFKTCLGIGLGIKMISRQVLVLVLNRKGGLAKLCLVWPGMESFVTIALQCLIWPLWTPFVSLSYVCLPLFYSRNFCTKCVLVLKKE